MHLVHHILASLSGIRPKSVLLPSGRKVQPDKYKTSGIVTLAPL